MKNTNFTDAEFRERVIKGLDLAYKRLLESKRKTGGYLIISENGQIKKIKASDIKDIVPLKKQP
jgi:hypothetical protein